MSPEKKGPTPEETINETNRQDPNAQENEPTRPDSLSSVDLAKRIVSLRYEIKDSERILYERMKKEVQRVLRENNAEDLRILEGEDNIIFIEHCHNEKLNQAIVRALEDTGFMQARGLTNWRQTALMVRLVSVNLEKLDNRG